MTRAVAVDRFHRGRCLTFLIGAESLLSEIRWSAGFAESRYRIDCAGFFGFFTRTDILASEIWWSLGM